MRVRRREFIAALGVAAIAGARAAGAQQRAVPTIGWLDVRSADAPRDFVDAFHLGLAEMGFAEGRNVAIDYRYAENHAERLPPLAAELVLRNVAVIMAPSGNSATAAKGATRTIPVVFTAGGDPIELGLVASFNRPAGNITGINILGIDIAAKRLELLHKLVPATEVIAVLAAPRSRILTRPRSRTYGPPRLSSGCACSFSMQHPPVRSQRGLRQLSSNMSELS